MRVLIIEDDDDLREILADQLHERNVTVFEACNGRHGLEVLEKEIVDLIISDVQMPIMDGMSFLKAFKAKYKKYPPIFIVTSGSQHSASEFLHEGADGFFYKPIDIDKLLTQKPKAA